MEKNIFKLMSKVVVFSLFQVSLFANYSSNTAYYACQQAKYSYDPIVSAIEKLECLIPYAKDTVGDSQRFDVFGPLNRSVRDASRKIQSYGTPANPNATSAINEVVENFCKIEESLEELEEAAFRTQIIDEILSAGAQILASRAQTCK